MNRFLNNFLIKISLVLFASVNLFANEYLLSPVEGKWANQQTLVIDVPEGWASYYSLTGSNPLDSGFAYDSPILLDMEGEVHLKIAVVKQDGQAIIEEVTFSCEKGNAFSSETLHQNSSNIIELDYENPLVIDESAFFSFSDEEDPYLSGRKIECVQDNNFSELLPLVIKKGDKLYRYLVKTFAKSKEQSELKNSKTEFQQEKKYATDKTLVELPLRECPVSLNFYQWTSVQARTPKNIYATVDNGDWKTGEFSFVLNREQEHLIYWLQVASEEQNSEEQDSEENQFPVGVVFCSKIPAKPSLLLEQNNLRSKAKVSIDSNDFKIALIQNKTAEKKLSKLDNSFTIDTIDCHELKSDILFMCYYDGIQMGTLAQPVIIDKLPPRPPKIIASSNGTFLRNDVNVSFVCDEDVYLYSNAVILSDSEVNKYSTNIDSKFSFRKSDAHPLESKMATCKAENEKAVLYSLASYAKDKAGNVSENAYYRVLIDSTNYYLNQETDVDLQLQDGSFTRPFSSFSQLKNSMKNGSTMKIHIFGNFVCEEPIVLEDNSCIIVSKTSSRISVNSPSFFKLKNSKVNIQNCIIEQNYLSKNNDFTQVNLFELDKSSLELKNCELVSVSNLSSSVFLLQDSSLKIEASGVSLQTSDYGSLYNAINSNIQCNSVRNSLTCDVATLITINSGKCNLYDSNFQVNGSSVKFYELFGVDYSMKNNTFLYKNLSKNMFLTDVFCKKSLYENNIARSF